MKTARNGCQARKRNLPWPKFLIVAGALLVPTVPGAGRTLGSDPGGGSSGIRRISYRTFDLRRHAAFGSPVVEVNLHEAPRVPKHFTLLEGMTIGGGIIAMGVGLLLLVPMAQGPLAGGILLFPMLSALGITNDAHTAEVTRAFREVNFPRHLQASLRKRLAGAFGPKENPVLRLEVLIRGYGLVRHRRELCFAFDGKIRVRSRETELFDGRLFMGPRKRSLDSPPPRCARLAELAAENGTAAREILLESGKILSAIITNRMEVAP